jgi:16S rRNA U1498 N3-methylase RsmE
MILLKAAEIGKPLARRDERTIHLLKVLHKKTGDSFDAGVLGGSRGLGRIESIRLDGSVTYSLDLREQPSEHFPIRIAVGFPRPIQIKRLLRDLSNLGLEAVDLIGTELGEKSYRDTKLFTSGGAEAALIEGAVQARDTTIPALSVYDSLGSWLAERPWEKPLTGNCDGSGSLHIGTGINRFPLFIALDNVRPDGAFSLLSAYGRAIVLAVGSERGWSDKERNELERASFVRLSMGSRAMRTETACVAAAVLALEKTGALR